MYSFRENSPSTSPLQSNRRLKKDNRFQKNYNLSNYQTNQKENIENSEATTFFVVRKDEIRAITLNEILSEYVPKSKHSSLHSSKRKSRAPIPSFSSSTQGPVDDSNVTTTKSRKRMREYENDPSVKENHKKKKSTATERKPLVMSHRVPLVEEENHKKEKESVTLNPYLQINKLQTSPSLSLTPRRPFSSHVPFSSSQVPKTEQSLIYEYETSDGEDEILPIQYTEAQLCTYEDPELNGQVDENLETEKSSLSCHESPISKLELQKVLQSTLSRKELMACYLEEILIELGRFQNSILKREPSSSLSSLLAMKEIEKINVLTNILSSSPEEFFVEENKFSKEDTIAATISQMAKKFVAINKEIQTAVSETDPRISTLIKLLISVKKFLDFGEVPNVNEFKDLWLNSVVPIRNRVVLPVDLEKIIKQEVVRLCYNFKNKKRNLVLTKQFLRLYKEKPNHLKLKIEIPIQSITSISSLIWKHENQFRMVIEAKKKFVIECASRSAMVDWMLEIDNHLIEEGFISKIVGYEKKALNTLKTNHSLLF